LFLAQNQKKDPSENEREKAAQVTTKGQQQATGRMHRQQGEDSS
jgi:hypothetical protein